MSLVFAPGTAMVLLYMLFQVKSRMMGDSTYRNTVDCFIKTMKTEVHIFFRLSITISKLLSLSIQYNHVCVLVGYFYRELWPSTKDFSRILHD